MLDISNALHTIQSSIGPPEDAIAAAIANCPEPIRKNALLAVNHLICSAVDLPLSFLEGWTAEQRALTDARVKVIDATASKLADQIGRDATPTAYGQASFRKNAERIIRGRRNVDDVVRIALEELKGRGTKEEGSSGEADAPSSESSQEVAPISEDWLNQFEREAMNMSSEQMKSLFGRVLAGQIRRSGSYSIKTVRLLSEFDQSIGLLWQQLCSLTIGIKAGQRESKVYLVLSPADPRLNALSPYGLSVEKLSILTEFGLITPDHSTQFTYKSPLASTGRQILYVTYLDDLWCLSPVDISTEIRLAGLGLTLSGQELLPIVDKVPNAQYTTDLVNHLQSVGIVMKQIESPEMREFAYSHGMVMRPEN